MASTRIRLTVFPAQALREARQLSTVERARIAREGAATARSRAPVETGKHRDGIRAEVSGDIVRVVDDDPEAFWKEYGTATTPAHATLTNTMRAYGRYAGFHPKGR